jgi:hypothetical protein
MQFFYGFLITPVYLLAAHMPGLALDTPGLMAMKVRVPSYSQEDLTGLRRALGGQWAMLLLRPAVPLIPQQFF